MIAKKKSKLLYRELALKLNEVIPVQWAKILFYSEVKEGVISVYLVFYENKQVKDSLSLMKEYGLNKKQYTSIAVGLSRIVSKINQSFIEEGEQKWTTMTFILFNDGNFKVDFGYEDLTESDVVERRAAWKAKYL